MENGSALLLDVRLVYWLGHAEGLAVPEMTKPHAGRTRVVALGADCRHNAADFVGDLRTLNVRQHVAQNASRRRSPIEHRTTRQAGYAAGLHVHKRIEEVFGWVKAVSCRRRTRLRGRKRVDWSFTFAAAAYNCLPRFLDTSA